MGPGTESAPERRVAGGFRLRAEPSGAGLRAPLRICGPGRLERGYQARLEGLGRELELAALVERGAQRRADACERDARAAARRARELEQRSHRLMLALGALQRENEGLRAAIAAAAAPRLEAPRPRGLLRRWLGRR